nr:carbonic anhydrase 1-like [Bactrocera oleae]
MAKCTGKLPNPLNIDSVDIVNQTYPPFAIWGFQEEPKTAELINNGYTIFIRLTYVDDHPAISGGPLNEKFIYEQLYFHWMGNDTFDSEDRTSTAFFPAELHMVFRNGKYPTLAKAAKESNGVAVLAYNYMVTKSSSFLYDPLMEIIENVVRPGAVAKFRSPVKLWGFITSEINHYYTYTGSLTTPPCSEDVIWIDFKYPIYISEKQIELFRKIYTVDKTPMIYSYRPLLPFNNNTVFSAISLMDPDDEYTEYHSAVPFVDRLVGGATMWKPVEINILFGVFSSIFMTTWIATTRQTMA